MLKLGSLAGNKLVAVTRVVLRSLALYESLIGVLEAHYWLANERRARPIAAPLDLIPQF